MNIRSETVTVTKEASMDVKVYEVSCSGCGDALEFNARTDLDGDILIEIAQHKCEAE